jgi:SAM-dependent methyltransferase
MCDSRAIDQMLWRLPGGRERLRQRGERREETHLRASMTRDYDLFAEGGHLPEHYGRGLSERAVEFGWLCAQHPRGRTLDAGSTLNHPYVLDNILPEVDALTIVTLAPEDRNFPGRGVEYVYADLRHLPFDTATFDTIVSISVMEHVGLDNTRYGANAERGDPQEQARRAMFELARVAKPGAQIVLTVPFGRSQTLDWVRVLDLEQLEDLVSVAQPSACHLSVYHDRGRGWQLSTPERAANAGYREYQAEAVACVKIAL